MPTTPPIKQAINVQAACLEEKPPSCNDFLADGNMLYRAEKSYYGQQCYLCSVSLKEGSTYHDSEAQA